MKANLKIHVIRYEDSLYGILSNVMFYVFNPKNDSLLSCTNFYGVECKESMIEEGEYPGSIRRLNGLGDFAIHIDVPGRSGIIVSACPARYMFDGSLYIGLSRSDGRPLRELAKADSLLNSYIMAYDFESIKIVYSSI